MVLTTLQVDNLASSKEIVLSRQRGTYPHKIEFSLIRTLVRPKITLTNQDETSQGTLNVATNCISRLRYILTYLPTTNTFKFLYSSSLCSVTDSVASKYLDIPNQKVMLDLLSQMFTQPLLELNRVAQRKTRSRLDNGILKDPEFFLNDFTKLPSSAVPFSSYGWSVIAMDDSVTSEEKRAILSRIRIATLILSTRLKMLLQQLHILDSSMSENDLIRSLLACVRYVFKEEYNTTGGLIITNSKQARVKEKDLSASAPERVNEDAETLSSSHRVGNVRIEIFSSASVHKRKQYELEFRAFDMASIRKELKVSKDESLHQNTSTSEDDSIPAGGPDLSGDVGVQLFITQAALVNNWESDNAGQNAALVPRGTALELLNFVETNGGMHNAFLADFNRAWERSRLSYWLKPNRWTAPLASEGNFAKVCKHVQKYPEHIPGYVDSDDKNFEHVLSVARELYSASLEDLPRFQKRLEGCHKYFQLETFSRGGSHSKNYIKGGIRNPHYLAILCLAYMHCRPELTIQDAIQDAPFIPEETKEKFRFKKWRSDLKGYQKRDPLVRQVSEISVNLLGFDPRWPVGLHENIFRRFYSSFFKGRSRSAELPVLIENWNASVHSLLPQFANGFNNLASERFLANSAKLKTARH
jgi:DNA-binding transcriptional regulator YiaG